MARISDTLIVQLVGGDRLVVMNPTDMQEVVIQGAEIPNFLAACDYLIGHMDAGVVRPKDNRGSVN